MMNDARTSAGLRVAMDPFVLFMGRSLLVGGLLVAVPLADSVQSSKIESTRVEDVTRDEVPDSIVQYHRGIISSHRYDLFLGIGPGLYSHNRVHVGKDYLRTDLPAIESVRELHAIQSVKDSLYQILDQPNSFPSAP